MDDQSLLYEPKEPTTQPPTTSPVTEGAFTSLVTTEESPTEAEFTPIFFDDINATEAQIEECGGDLQCLFDLVVTNDTTIAMETRNRNMETDRIRELTGSWFKTTRVCNY